MLTNFVLEYIDKLYNYLSDYITESMKPSCKEMQPPTMASTAQSYTDRRT